ncbi:MAG: alpha-L-fucosidase [Planctomycetia bacterium]|nr:alpha-L-fucosidase [Planctomycetia bacterium]
MTTMDRRRFIGITAGMACLGGAEFLVAEEAKPYVRADTDWLAKCRYGIGVHWTASTVPRKGPPLPFQEAVDAFDVKRFVDQMAHAGADYLLFTSTHALQMLPAPHPVIDRILPGRTCKRDLIAELADALAVKGMALLIYYNHSCNSKDDPPWELAVGYHDRDKNRLAQNLLEIVGWMGEQYKDKIRAWWFDSPYSLDVRGPHNSVTTDMSGFQFPWERFTVAAKLGYPARLVTYNAGINETFLYTTHQDYWAGEQVDLKHPPQGRFLPNGLQWFGWTCLEDRAWAHYRPDTEIPKPLYADEEVVSFVRACNSHQAPMTFNVGIYQDGTMPADSVEQLHRLRKAL